MMCENDKLNIPEKYRLMSVSELQAEKEKVYEQIRRNASSEANKQTKKEETITFHF